MGLDVWDVRGGRRLMGWGVGGGWGFKEVWGWVVRGGVGLNVSL